MKLLRVLIAFRLLQWAVSRARLAPHAISEPRLAGERLSGNEIQRALVVVLLFLLVAGASWLPFVASGYDPLDSLFEVASAAGTVGLTTGISRSELEAPLKLILCADMLLGRVEVLAVHQMFGHYNGRIVTNDGEEIAIRGLVGWAEDHVALW